MTRAKYGSRTHVYWMSEAITLGWPYRSWATRISVLLVLSCWFLVVLSGCSVERAPVDKTRINRLHAEGNIAVVRSELSGIVWNKKSIPELLIAYCVSQFALSPQSETCELGPRSSKDLQRVADALWLTWAGRTREATSTLVSLVKAEDSNAWGLLGKLELATYTENHLDLAILFASAESSRLRSDSRFRDIYISYYAGFLESTLEWDRLGELLKGYREQEIVADPYLFSSVARFYYVKGRSQDLNGLLNAAKGTLENATVYQERKADNSVLAKGIGAASAEMASVAKSNPGNSELAMRIAYRELMSDSPVIAKGASETLFKIAEESSNNVRLLLDMATDLARYHKPAESGQVFRLIDRDKVNLDDFAVAHVLGAWIHVYEGDLARAKRELDVALTMAPKHVPANWLRVLIAKKKGDRREGTEGLRVLLAADPYNRNYRNIAKHFADTLKVSEVSGLYKALPPMLE